MSDQIDIRREAVELAARWLHVQHGMFDEGNLILALRATLDAAEASLADGSFYKESDIDALIARAEAAEARERRAVEAINGLLDWDKSRKFIVPYRVRDPLVAAAIRTGAKP